MSEDTTQVRPKRAYINVSCPHKRGHLEHWLQHSLSAPLGLTSRLERADLFMVDTDALKRVSGLAARLSQASTNPKLIAVVYEGEETQHYEVEHSIATFGCIDSNRQQILAREALNICIKIQKAA